MVVHIAKPMKNEALKVTPLVQIYQKLCFFLQITKRYPNEFWWFLVCHAEVVWSKRAIITDIIASSKQRAASSRHKQQASSADSQNCLGPDDVRPPPPGRCSGVDVSSTDAHRSGMDLGLF